jgi:hypothetical protein
MKILYFKYIFLKRLNSRMRLTPLGSLSSWSCSSTRCKCRRNGTTLLADLGEGLHTRPVLTPIVVWNNTVCLVCFLRCGVAKHFHPMVKLPPPSRGHSPSLHVFLANMTLSQINPYHWRHFLIQIYSSSRGSDI